MRPPTYEVSVPLTVYMTYTTCVEALNEDQALDAVLDMVRSEGASLIAEASRDDYEFERRDIEIHPVERAADWSAV